jgi:hypothetical protein
MSEQRYGSFEEFWPFYVREHANRLNRRLHFAGTSAAVACAALGLLTKRKWLLALAPVAGYGPAWIGHFFVEKNRPATFEYPLWSLRADFVMWWKIATDTMDEEVERAVAEEAAREAAKAAPPEPKPNGAGRDTLN